MNSKLYFFIPEWPVLYIDNHILAIYKPAGLLIQGDRTGRISLIDLVRLWIKQTYSKPGNVYVGLVHRLDFHVAGVAIFARTSKAASRLSDQFRRKMVKKEYIAVVEGVPARKKSRLVHYLIRKGNKTYAIDIESDHQAKAILDYNTIDSDANFSLLKIFPLTGKKHQIRAQLSAIGHPILGDKLYGSKTKTEINAIALFATSITFIHPTLRTHITINVSLPHGWPWFKRKTVDTSSHIPWTFADFKKRLHII